MQAYSAFHSYSVGNQMLAVWQCKTLNLEPGPINTFPKWKELGRHVKRGQRALTLCMPITRKRRLEVSGDDKEERAGTYTSFIYKARWFVLAQTEGEEPNPIAIPQWSAEQALINLSIEQIAFDLTDGNVQGFARRRQLAINPLAQLAHKTFLHEAAHIVLGHTSEGEFADGETTPRNLREVEAEAVALLCCESLGLEGADFCRGYLQDWSRRGSGLADDVTPEKSAQNLSRRRSNHSCRTCGSH